MLIFKVCYFFPLLSIFLYLCNCNLNLLAMIKIKDILESVKSAPKEFPVETAIGLTFAIATMLAVENVVHRFYPLAFCFIIFVIAITLRKINKIAYYASYFLIWVAFLLFHSGRIIEQPWFWVLNIIAAIVLTADLSKNDNKQFANTVISRLGQMASAALLSGILAAMVSAIIGSVIYLFNADLKHLLAHVNIFIGFVIMPLTFCYLQEHINSEENDESRLLRIVMDYIVSPALVIYTVVLLVYVLKILFAMELPRGGVAYMVSIYIGLVLVGNLLNKLVQDSHFNWFYDNFAYIAIAPIVLLWVGTIYRINEYGLTEWRVYLLIVNVLMTIFPFMLKIPAANRYNLMTFVLMAVMVIFTCIPPISAANISLRNQYSRFVAYAQEIGVFDTSTWNLRNDIDVDYIKEDSVANSKYLMMRSEYYYLKARLDSISDKYGDWNYWYSFDDNGRRLEFDHPLEYLKANDFCDAVPIDGANRYLLDCNAIFDYDSNRLKVFRNDRIVLEYAVQDSINANLTAFRENPLRFLRAENDSVMVIILEMSGREIDGTFDVEDISSYDVRFFGK